MSDNTKRPNPPLGARSDRSRSPLAFLAAALFTLAVGAFGLSLLGGSGPRFPTWKALQGASPARPIDVSVSGHLGDHLFDFTTKGITFLFVIMCGVILWAATKHGPAHKAVYDHGDTSKALVLTSVVTLGILFVLDGTLLYGSFVDLGEAFYNFPKASDNPLTIEVQAQQWAWNFRYPGPDGKFNTADDIVTLNDMHMPVGRPVLLRLTSKDVIHSFYVPNFRTKIDAFPGTQSRLWFQATQPGEFEIGCAQHCGANHFKMRSQLTVDTPDRYNDWERMQVAENQRRYDPNDVEAHWGWDWEY
jgi:cytochrome c oxidase subunit II